MVADSPVILLVNAPVPVPSEVLEAEGTVGFVVVDQTTPLVVPGYPPSEEIFPPLVAEVAVIELVLTVIPMVAGEPVPVVKLISVP